MKTTIASGWSCATWRAASLPQSTSTDWEIAVPMCGSRIVLTPAWPASERATSRSSGIDMESPVTSTVCSGRGGAGFRPRARASKASGVTGGTPPARAPAAGAEKPPGPEPRSLSGESQAVRGGAAEASGSWSAIHPAGRPTASTNVRPGPEPISRPWRRMDGPSQRMSSTAATPTTISASRARKRRPRRSQGGRGVSSEGDNGSEAEVDERGHALAGHGGGHRGDDDRQPGAEERRVQALEPAPEGLDRALGQQLQADDRDHRGHDRRGPQRGRARGEQAPHDGHRGGEVLGAEEDPTQHDEVEGHE